MNLLRFHVPPLKCRLEDIAVYRSGKLHLESALASPDHSILSKMSARMELYEINKNISDTENKIAKMERLIQARRLKDSQQQGELLCLPNSNLRYGAQTLT